MAERQWLELHAVVRCDPELVDKLHAWLNDSDLVEVNRLDVVHLDEDLRRWDGGRPAGVVVDQFELLRQGHELHEQPRPGEPTLHLLERD